MRNLQRVINQAIEDKVFKLADYPFGEKKYSINKRLDNKTKKIAIHLDKISKLKSLNLNPKFSNYTLPSKYSYLVIIAGE